MKYLHLINHLYHNLFFRDISIYSTTVQYTTNFFWDFAHRTNMDMRGPQQHFDRQTNGSSRGLRNRKMATCALRCVMSWLNWRWTNVVNCMPTCSSRTLLRTLRKRRESCPHHHQQRRHVYATWFARFVYLVFKTATVSWVSETVSSDLHHRVDDQLMLMYCSHQKSILLAVHLGPWHSNIAFHKEDGWFSPVVET